MSQEAFLHYVERTGLCTGCGGCTAVTDQPKISMTVNASGYMRPSAEIPLSAEEERRVKQICPGVLLRHESRDASFHPIWGPVRRSLTGFALDAEVRFRGSSGGAISALLLYLLESGKVDGVVQIAVSGADPFRNEARISRTRTEVLEAAGSRYAPAAPLEILREALDSGGRYAFVGKPCDVAALRQIGRIDSRIDAVFPYMLSFMCAGTPSIKGTHEVVAHLGTSPEQVVSFRYRGNGWPGKACAKTKDGTVLEMDYESSWGKILNRHLQFRCKICPDGTGEFSDVTCADAWFGDQKGYPSFSEQEGRSVILARSDKGDRLIEEAGGAGYLSFDSLPIKDIAKMQPYQVERKKAVSYRLVGFRVGGRKIPTYSKLGLLRAGLTLKPKLIAKNLIGAFVRAGRG